MPGSHIESIASNSGVTSSSVVTFKRHGEAPRKHPSNRQLFGDNRHTQEPPTSFWCAVMTKRIAAALPAPPLEARAVYVLPGLSKKELIKYMGAPARLVRAAQVEQDSGRTDTPKEGAPRKAKPKRGG